MALSVGMISHAEDTTTTADAITIDSITFAAHETDDTLVNATVAFTAVETAEEVTILMSTDANVADNDDIMYINQVAQPEDGKITFAIEKSRILAAKGEGATDINNTEMFVKMGGTDIDTMASLSQILSLAPAYKPGDADGSDMVDSDDATAILCYLAGWDVTATPAMDCDGSNMVDSDDATAILCYLAGWDVTLK
jgi:hypothetical protein